MLEIDLMKDVKLLYIDLDGTLIQTISGKTFAEDVTDFRIRLEVVKRLREMVVHGLLRAIAIVSNQGGIPEYVGRQDFDAKLEAVGSFVETYTGAYVIGLYCDSIDSTHPDRKPNTGMLERVHSALFDHIQPYEMLMVGDASGKEGDFSDTDRRCAENYGIAYMDVEDFINHK